MQLCACGSDPPIVGRLRETCELAQSGYGLDDGLIAGTENVPRDAVTTRLMEVKSLGDFDGVLKEGSVGWKFNSIEYSPKKC